MAFETLSPAAAIWRHAGLGYLLLEKDDPILAGLDAAVPELAAEKPAQAPKRPGLQGPKPVPSPPKQPASQISAAAPGWRPMPEDLWPAAWRQELALARRGLVAWTYLGLGQDLIHARQKDAPANDSGRKQRGDFLRRIIKDLGHPQGTHTFWPAEMPDSQDNADTNRNAFWSGLRALGCRGVVIMGNPPAAFLLQEKNLRPLTQFRKYGQFVWITNNINDLATNKNFYEATLAFLRQSLRHVIGNRLGNGFQ